MQIVTSIWNTNEILELAKEERTAFIMRTTNEKLLAARAEVYNYILLVVSMDG